MHTYLIIIYLTKITVFFTYTRFTTDYKIHAVMKLKFIFRTGAHESLTVLKCFLHCVGTPDKRTVNFKMTNRS